MMTEQSDFPTHDMEALIAGTVALMTCWANPAREAATSEDMQRLLIARKIVSNLLFLQSHPEASDSLRHVMSCAHDRWMALIQPQDHGLRDAAQFPAVRLSALMH